MQLAANLAQEASKSIFQCSLGGTFEAKLGQVGPSWGQVGAKLGPSWSQVGPYKDEKWHVSVT